MITIVTPVFNGEKFIESCLQAVIDQHCSDVEHWIMDGSSTDNTITIVKNYADRYPHIRWISEPDRGQSDAMNKGIRLATGEIITFLNVDDYYEPNVLNQVNELFKTLPEPSFVVGNCQIWNDYNQIIDINKPTKLRLLDLVVGINVNPYPCNPCAYFYHRSLHDQIGDYAIDDHHAMDLDFILRAVQVAHIQYVDQIWGNYRRIAGTKTFIAMADGSSDRRVRQLLRKYRQHLTPIERIEWLYWKLWTRSKSLWLRAIRKLFHIILNDPAR
ncbi:glycosyltransferase family 2 protein [Leptolyngbya sp. AN03gr2]|uniref:glycosyltransferase family 2 protein n=1 Tax=unclassified Leptolyngbya TaxID=2650499 RepID=UPI003D322102